MIDNHTTRQTTCPLCGTMMVAASSLFCPSCRLDVDRMATRESYRPIIIHLVSLGCVEVFFGVLTGFLVLLPIAAMSSSQLAWHEVLFMFGFNVALIAPIMASLYTWMLRPWVHYPQAWAILNTTRALVPGVLMFCAVMLGLRLDTFPEVMLSLVVLISEGCIRGMTAWWQRRYLVPPLQQRVLWDRWGLVGWSLGTIVHLLVLFLLAMGGNASSSLFFGTVMAYTVSGIVSHTILAHFAVTKQLVERVKQVRQSLYEA